MNLYHFTNRQNFELILKDGKIKSGSYRKDQKVEHGLVSLTTDLNPYGHGLTDGREISVHQVKQLKYATERYNKYYCVDNTEFCIRLFISSNNLISASSMHKKEELEQILEIVNKYRK